MWITPFDITLQLEKMKWKLFTRKTTFLHQNHKIKVVFRALKKTSINI